MAERQQEISEGNHDGPKIPNRSKTSYIPGLPVIKKTYNHATQQLSGDYSEVYSLCKALRLNTKGKSSRVTGY